jgi:hypothetical protein
MSVPVIESVVQRVGMKETSTADDCATGIGPLEAELAAKGGREWTALGKLIFVGAADLGEMNSSPRPKPRQYPDKEQPALRPAVLFGDAYFGN